MKVLVKSFVAGVIATGVFFSFLMMLVIPATALRARWHGPLQAQDVVVSPMPFLRTFGLPLSALVFLMTFGLSLRQFGRRESPPNAAAVPSKSAAPSEMKRAS